jgi:hypothetical protein
MTERYRDREGRNRQWLRGRDRKENKRCQRGTETEREEETVAEG